MVEAIFAIVSVILLFISLALCVSVCDKYRSDRNVFRDKWIDTVEKFNRHLIDNIYDLESEIDDLKDDIAKLKTKDNEEETNNA